MRMKKVDNMVEMRMPEVLLSRCTKSLGSTLDLAEKVTLKEKHMGQFLQDRENGLFVSRFFFKK